jgi:CheY-like chemotaxis protein
MIDAAAISAPQAHDSVPPLRVASHSNPSLWNLNVLLVEDDAADASLILSVLQRHASVSTARAMDSPALALSQVATGRIIPDLVLLDIHMPRINGFQFLERLRQIPSMVSVPVVFLTTSGLDRDVSEYVRGSAVSYVLKPDSYGELQTRLDAVIKRAVSRAWIR